MDYFSFQYQGEVHNSLSPRTFIQAVIGFVKILREKHSHIPILLMSPIYASEREDTENSAGLSIIAMRQYIEEAAARLKEAGDPNLHYINGLEIISQADASYLPDDLHPNEEGYKLMAERFIEKATPMLGS